MWKSTNIHSNVCSGIELNDQCLKIKKNHYLGEAIGTKESEVESIIARIRSG